MEYAVDITLHFCHVEPRYGKTYNLIPSIIMFCTVCVNVNNSQFG